MAEHAERRFILAEEDGAEEVWHAPIVTTILPGHRAHRRPRQRAEPDRLSAEVARLR